MSSSSDSEESSLTGLFWDVKDYSIPDDLASDLGSICQHIKYALAKENYCGEKKMMSISAYVESDSKLLPAATALSETPLEVLGDEDSRVRRMVHDVLIWAADNPVPFGGRLIVVSEEPKLSEILSILKARGYSVRTLTTEWVSRILSDRREDINQSESGSGSLSDGTLPLKIVVSNPKSTIEDNDSEEESHHKFLERSYKKGKAEHIRACKSCERQRDRRRRRSMSPTSSESDERREKRARGSKSRERQRDRPRRRSLSPSSSESYGRREKRARGSKSRERQRDRPRRRSLSPSSSESYGRREKRARGSKRQKDRRRRRA